MSENKSFKQFRHELQESEYAEVLTGYPNRSAAPCGAIKFDSDLIARANGVLNAISRSTFMHPNDAFIKIKTRLNLLMLDFPWTPYLWQDGGTGITTINVTRYGRVDGVDALTGEIRMDGKANTIDGFKEYVLTATTERGEDGLFRVTAKLSSKEDIQMEESWGGGFETSREAQAKVQAGAKADAKREQMVLMSSIRAVMSGQMTKAQFKKKIGQSFGKIPDLAKKKAMKGKVVKESLVGNQRKLDVNKNKKLDAQDFKLLRAKKKPVKEEAEAVQEMYKAGDTVKVPHKGKMVKGKIVRHDKGGSGKAQQHGGGYVVDVGEYGSITVPHHKVVKEYANLEFTTGIPLMSPDPAMMPKAPEPKAHRKVKRKG